MRLRTTILFALTISTLFSFGCGELLASTGGQTTKSHADREPPRKAKEKRSFADVSGKGDIYGDDGRSELHETDSEVYRKVAASTAMLVDTNKLDYDEDEQTFGIEPATLRERFGVCGREPYADQPAPGFCSGFLVGARTLVTAGHCLTERSCETSSVVFGFSRETEGEAAPLEIDEKDVYGCESIVEGDYDSGGADFAVVRLSRPVEGRSPLDFRRTGRIPDDAPLTMVGHPIGLPLKIDVGGHVIDNEAESFITYNLDTYGGNSGSAVIDPETGVVEAVHVRGTRDFVPAAEENCLVSRHCAGVEPQTSCRGNEGTRSTVFARFVVPEPDTAGRRTFTDADGRFERDAGTVVAEIYIPEIENIDTFLATLSVDATSEVVFDARLERGSPEGGESETLLRDQTISGPWEVDFDIDKYEGTNPEGTWRLILEPHTRADTFHLDEAAIQITSH